MAQYWTDFSEHTADAQPSDWTERWHTDDGTALARSGGVTTELGGQYLELATTANSRYSASWDDIDGDAGKDDAEILARFKVQGSISVHTLYFNLRGSGSDGNESSYNISYYFGSTLYLSRYVNGVSTTLATGPVNLELDTYHWARFRVNGSTLQVKSWKDTEEEPEDWQLETTDTNVTAGWVGAQLSQSSSTAVIDYFAVGTSGDQAPAPAVDPSVEVRTTQAYVEVVSQDTALPEARVTQTYTEVVSQDTTPPEARVTQAYVEVLRSPPPQIALIASQSATETLITDDPPLWATQSATETLVLDNPPLLATQMVIEVLMPNPDTIADEAGLRGYIFIAT